MNAAGVQRIAAFSDGTQGGNPAGVWIGEALPPAATMQRIAHEIGYSETAFAAPLGDGWRVRYFSPESEVPFCGHATIALGAALAASHGDGVYPLALNDAAITVEGRRSITPDGAVLTSAALQSHWPATCATSSGRTAAPSTSSRARTWACARACGPTSGRSRALRSVSRAPRGRCRPDERVRGSAY
jgi:predicted PhzF superfamily epimerase YddE/YHI9